jgi:hypothetical protein
MKLAIFALPSLMVFEPAEKARVTCAQLEVLAETNLIYLRKTTLPSIFNCGIRYRLSEEWADIPRILETRFADCRGIAAWRMAELRMIGQDPAFHITYTEYPDGEMLHVKIETERGTEDPSEQIKNSRPQLPSYHPFQIRR